MNHHFPTNENYYTSFFTSFMNMHLLFRIRGGLEPLQLITIIGKAEIGRKVAREEERKRGKSVKANNHYR